MEVHDVEIHDHRAQRFCKTDRTIDPPEPTRRKIVDLNAVEIDWPAERYITVPWTIDTGSEDMYAMAISSERAAKGMHGIDGPAITDGRMICGYDVQNSHIDVCRIGASLRSRSAIEDRRKRRLHLRSGSPSR